MRIIFIAGLLAVLSACQSLPKTRSTPAVMIKEVSTDETYGYTEQNPIKVGGYATVGARNEYIYLRMLRGPKGAPIRYSRVGTCCAFKTQNNPYGNYVGKPVGVLDVFKVWLEGQDEPVTLYINGYDYEQTKAPKGFTF